MPDGKPRRLLMGRIGAAHGVRGEVRIQSFTEEPLALKDYGELSTDRPGLSVTIESARATTNVLVAKLKGVSDRTAAEKLNGVELYLDREKLPPIKDEDDFYLADLIGLEARAVDQSLDPLILCVRLAAVLAPRRDDHLAHALADPLGVAAAALRNWGRQMIKISSHDPLRDPRAFLANEYWQTTRLVDMIPNPRACTADDFRALIKAAW